MFCRKRQHRQLRQLRRQLHTNQPTKTPNIIIFITTAAAENTFCFSWRSDGRFCHTHTVHRHFTRGQHHRSDEDLTDKHRPLYPRIIYLDLWPPSTNKRRYLTYCWVRVSPSSEREERGPSSHNIPTCSAKTTTRYVRVSSYVARRRDSIYIYIYIAPQERVSGTGTVSLQHTSLTEKVRRVFGSCRHAIIALLKVVGILSTQVGANEGVIEAAQQQIRWFTKRHGGVCVYICVHCWKKTHAASAHPSVHSSLLSLPIIPPRRCCSRAVHKETPHFVHDAYYEESTAPACYTRRAQGANSATFVPFYCCCTYIYMFNGLWFHFIFTWSGRFLYVPHGEPQKRACITLFLYWKTILLVRVCMHVCDWYSNIYAHKKRIVELYKKRSYVPSLAIKPYIPRTSPIQLLVSPYRPPLFSFAKSNNSLYIIHPLFLCTYPHFPSAYVGTGISVPLCLLVFVLLLYILK